MKKGTISPLTSTWSHTGWKHHVIASTLGCVAISSLLLLAACGDSGSGSDDKLAREVGSIFELGPCTADREGDTVFVKDKKIDYLCTDEDWVDITTLADDDTSYDDKHSDDNPDDPFVKQETVQDRSELSLCNESGRGEEVLVLQDSLYFMCDGTKWVPDSARGYLVRNASITGAAIKGPFKFNSLLELRELRLANDSLRYSGNVYPDEISSNKGDFVIPKVNLVFPYGELVVRGQWQNEVSGQWSKDSLTLRALVDLSSRTEANVNLLTELEYDRAVNLVNNGYSVFAAKKQAQYEIMTAFGFATTIENAESLKMFVDSASDQHDASATLMAVSLLFLGDRSEASVVAAIDSFKANFTQNGSWDDNQAKAAMADWAEGFDAGTVRVNVKSWNISDVPKFETYLNSFWNNVYGLGGCAKNRYGTITKNTNELSRNYDVHYICIDDLWRRASDYEKDTYQWKPGKEGDIRQGDVTGADYVFRNGVWTAVNGESGDRTCDRTREGEKLAEEGSFYVCENSVWKEIDENSYYVVKNISVLGSAQKGPFKFDSPLKIREMRLLNDSLVYTGREYVDEISSNKGDFVVPKVSLAYPYATLEVRGLWRNEITGEWSGDSMTLRALTELSDKANINILTHLEYDRAINLVKKGYSVSAAKTQADYEIMTAFTIIPTTSNSEAKETFGDGADPTLLALAILFMADRSDTEIQRVIDDFKADIAGDGVWNDEQTKAQMADYAEGFNSSVVHANVKNWNISGIPNFEAQLATFWNNVYGLGGCGSTRDGVVLPNNNSLSENYGLHYICKTNAWRRATDFEKDTYQWIAGTTGEVKKGNVTDTYYTYNGSRWVVADRENAIGLCVGTTGVVKEYNGTYYICKSGSWTTATALEYDTYGWTAGTEGEVRAGSVNTSNYYVYENGAWRASANAIENNLGACVTSRQGEVGKSGNTYYTCKNDGWTTATALEYDTYGWTAGTEGEVRTGSVSTSNYYVYENGAWRSSANTIENNLGACVTSRLGEVGKSGNTYYTCKTDGWTTATALEYDTYGWSNGYDGEIRKGSVTNTYYLFNGTNWSYAERENEIGLCIGSTGVVAEYDGAYYICKSNNWREANEFEYDTYCLGIETDGTVKAGCVNTNNYYIYKSNEWIAATQLEYDTYCLGVVEDGTVRKGCVNTRLYYVYENGAWRASTNTIENNLGACVTSRLGEVGKSGNTYYICKSNGWQMATTLEYDTYGKECTKNGFIVNGNVSVYNKYVCDDEMFRAANAKEISLNKGCVSYTINAQIKIKISEALDSLYTCENNLWNGSVKTYYVQGSMVDKRDNQTYKTVTIGMQKWMAQNLNYEYRLGMYSQSWCYNNSTNNCTKYGRLYTWAGAMDSAGLFTTNGTNCGNDRTCSPTYPVRGICPEGWHLPKKSEIETLFTAIGGKATAGLMMKSTSDWFNNQNGLDAYSYSAIPAGYMNDRGSFKDNSFYANFWTASQYNSYSAYYMELGTGNGASLSDFGNKGYGFSIRCLQN